MYLYKRYDGSGLYTLVDEHIYVAHYKEHINLSMILELFIMCFFLTLFSLFGHLRVSYVN